MYHSIEIWKLNHILTKIKNGTLTFADKRESFGGDYAEPFSQLINGFPPIQIFIHRGKIHSEYFTMLYGALTEEGEVAIEVNKLEVWGGMEIEDAEPDEIMINVTDLMDTTKFFTAAKKLNLTEKTMHTLSMKMATILYETCFPVIIADDSLDEGDLKEYIDRWLICG